MRIYLLVPLHTDDPIWMFSVQSEAVQVLAPSESEARLRASLRYGRRRTAERAVAPRDPWLDPRWVFAHLVDKADSAIPVLGWEPAPHAAPETAPPAARTEVSRGEQSRR